MKNPTWIVAAIILAIVAVPTGAALAAGCPTEPDWSYTGSTGPAFWNTLFPDQCGLGTRQSPINIVSSDATMSSHLPKLTFHYFMSDVVTLDHDDNQKLVGAQTGNYIMIGETKYFLDNIHAHTPSEHTINGQRFPLELHFVNKSANGSLAAVGVLVEVGKPNPGIIEPPSYQDPSSVDFRLGDLIPSQRSYWRYNGGLTTPGEDATATRCPQGILWTVMTHPITMSADQIKAFEDSGYACWDTNDTARPVQPVNARFVLFSPH